MTHMAPEILLEGRVSKAVDVGWEGGGREEEGDRGDKGPRLQVWALWPWVR